MEQERILTCKPVMRLTEGPSHDPETFPACRYEVNDQDNSTIGYITNRRALGRMPAWEVTRDYGAGFIVAAADEYITEQDDLAALERLCSPCDECSDCVALMKARTDAYKNFVCYRPMHTDRRPRSRWYKDDRNEKDRLERCFNLADAKYEHHRLMHSPSPKLTQLARYENIIRRYGLLNP